jgi:diadenosine tetraphosphatase ApaH/serine/threonine PP2A family protein phosphatase
MKAIISDIHSNLEALEAVRADLAAQHIQEIYCLGDTIGYGPNPRECLDIVRKQCKVVLLGNHDQAAVFDPKGFNPAAERATFWTRKQLDAPVPNRRASEERWEFLGELATTHRDGDYLFVHGSPRKPVDEYIFPEDIYNQRKMQAIFGLVKRYCFQGHTHTPGIFTEDLQFYSPEEIDSTYVLGERKVLCNVGSVGQPRDGDPRACYVVLDGLTIHFRRVPYDFETTIAKITDNPDLDDFLGGRLRDGR